MTEILVIVILVALVLYGVLYIANQLSSFYRPYDGQLIYEEKLGGYWGYGDGFSSSVQVIDYIDLPTLMTLAQAYGYNATYKPATIFPFRLENEEYCSIRREVEKIRISYSPRANETLFDYAIPTWALIDLPYPYNTSKSWFESRLREFFPNLTDGETSDFAGKLASGSIKIYGSPKWESVKNYLGAFSHVTAIRTSSITEYYSKGRIGYETPSVTIRQTTILEDNKSVTFIISANSQGFVTIYAETKYFLNINWIRAVFAKMFFEVGLPITGIFKFTLVENWYIVWVD